MGTVFLWFYQILAFPRAALRLILVGQRGSQMFSGLSDYKSLITPRKSAQNQRNLSGYKSTYNLAKTKKRQSNLLRISSQTNLISYESLLKRI